MKEYLKMGDVLKLPLNTGDDGSIGSIIGCDGNIIAQCVENTSMTKMSNRNRNELRNKVANTISHAINSHDELVAEVDRLNDEMQDILEMVDAAVRCGDFSIVAKIREKYISD